MNPGRITFRLLVAFFPVEWSGLKTVINEFVRFANRTCAMGQGLSAFPTDGLQRK